MWLYWFVIINSKHNDSYRYIIVVINRPATRLNKDISLLLQELNTTIVKMHNYSDEQACRDSQVSYINYVNGHIRYKTITTNTNKLI